MNRLRGDVRLTRRRCLCGQAASSGHGEKSAAVETSPVPAGDLLPPPAERPELFGGGEVNPNHIFYC